MRPGRRYPAKKCHHVRGYVGEVPMYHGGSGQGLGELSGRDGQTFCRTRHHYEIWNEPNTAPYGFWQTGTLCDLDRSGFRPHARDYVELVKISSSAIRRADPAKIIGGSISLTLDASSSATW